MILLLDDDLERLAGFRHCHPALGCELRTWTSAPAMLAEIAGLLPGARLISLDHDLYRLKDTDPDPGTGRVVAEFLARQAAVCPVIVHSTNTDAAWGMHNVLSAAGWKVELVHHLNESGWIDNRWLPAAQRLLEKI